MSSRTSTSTDERDDLANRVDVLEDQVTEEVARLSKELAQLRGRIHALEEDAGNVEAVDRDVIQELQEDIEELRHVVNVDLDGKSYKQLTPDDKVREIQASLVEEAMSRSTSKASMDYTEVRWLFNGRPSTGHVYDLMQVAGQEAGFDYQERDKKNRLVVDADDIPEGVKQSLQLSRRE